MKKLSRFTIIVITGIILPIFSFPSLAKDCPSVPKETKEVTVKDNDATLRTEPKKSSEKGSPIGKGDKLGVIDNKPTQDSEGNNYCWYKIKFLKGSNRKQYWIANIGLVEFSSWSVKQSSYNKYQQNNNQATNFSILIISIGLGVLSVSGIVFSLYCISLFKEYDKQIETFQENGSTRLVR